MFKEIFRFEIAYRLRRPLLYVFTAVFFILPFAAVSTDSVMLGGEIGNVARNAPYVIINMMAMMSALGLIIVTIFVANSVNRDNEEKIQELFYSKPLGKTGYLLGRYAGSVLPVIIAMVGSCLGIWLASIMPYQDTGRILPFTIWPYIFSMAAFAVPNFILSGAIFFSVATLTRKNFYAYVAVIAFLSLWGIGVAVMGDLENQTLTSLLDPFGIGPFKVMTRYWTIAERNTITVPGGSLLLVNRLLWMTVAAAVLIFTNWRYRMELPSPRTKKKDEATGEAEDTPASEASDSVLREDHHREQVTEEAKIASARSIAAADPTWRTRISQLFDLTFLETRSILHSIPFLIITLFGMANLISAILVNPEGTSSYPLTSHMLESIEGAFALMAWLVIIIYGAELVWKDRRVRIDGIMDSLPVPDWINLSSKLGALFSTMFVMAVLAMLCTAGYQVANGYYDIQFSLYLKGLFIIMLGEWFLLSVLSIFFQVVSGNRYIGTLLMVICFVLLDALPGMGFEHNLYLFAQIPSAPWSDMNGYGHFATAVFWFRLYWSLFAVILAIASTLLWMRGSDRDPRYRIYLARKRFGRTAATAFFLVTAAFISTGAWIYYNTNMINEYLTDKDIRLIAADYEKLYGNFRDLPQPEVIAADVEVDIYPQSRRVEIGGLMRLLNSTGAGIDTLQVNLDQDLDIAGLEIEGAQMIVDDRRTGFRIYSLDPPLADGDTLDVGLGIILDETGFMNGRSNLRIVENGTFFSSNQYIPSFGYDISKELDDPRRRREHGLPERERMPAVDDPAGLMRTFTHDADRIRFSATVSTSPDQIAIAPGDLVKKWTEGDRNYFRYSTGRPILNFYCFVSGRFDVVREMCGETEIEIYFHDRHRMNVPRILESVKNSLEYYTDAFSPYPYRQLRIVEFPGYRKFAQSFSTTIPFSEASNFTDDLTDSETVDMVYFITAHETAHQWFAHQVTPAWVQGFEMIGESLTQYAALMVMEKDYGPDRMKRFLRYELDKYLSGRSGEMIEEMPLMYVENQPYIHYHKGALVMYAMREYMGAELFAEVVKEYVDRTAFAGPPYTNSIDFLSILRGKVPEKYAYLVEDMFETITLYDNRVENASYTMTGDGRYLVTIDYLSEKMRADGKGYETSMEHEDWIEIGIYGEQTPESGSLGKVLFREKQQLTSGKGRIEIIVDEKPVRAGIDPRNLLIDRVPGDNTRKVSG